MLSEQPDKQALSRLLAHMHAQADDGGDQQKAQDDFRPLPREKHADKRQQVGENGSLEMGRDADDQRKQEKGSDKKCQGLPHRQQANAEEAEANVNEPAEVNAPAEPTEDNAAPAGDNPVNVNDLAANAKTVENTKSEPAEVPTTDNKSGATMPATTTTSTATTARTSEFLRFSAFSYLLCFRRFSELTKLAIICDLAKKKYLCAYH